MLSKNARRVKNFPADIERKLGNFTMLKLMKIILCCVALSFISFLLFARHSNVVAHASSGLPQPVLPQDQDEPARLHMSGLHGDRTQIPAMIAALQKPQPNWAYSCPALHALSRMGATEALPAITQLIQSKNYPIISREAEVAKARLLAEDSTKGLSGGSQAKAKIEGFYSNLGLTSDDINTRVEVYQSDLSQQLKANMYDGTLLKPLELFAMEEIADMVYHGSYSDYASLSGVARLNFESDDASALKIRLAPLTQPQRLTTLIDELANDASDDTKNLYRMQLISDEGVAGANAIAIKLRQMDANKPKYSRENFRTMFRTLVAIGDASQIPLVGHFKAQGDEKSKAVTEVVDTMDLRKGMKNQFVPGY